MPLRSMTGFAQVKGELINQSEGRGSLPSPSSLSPATQGNGHLGFALSLKSVNHRFLDLHFRLPSGSDSLEMQLRRLLKEKMARGHVEVTLSLERGGGETLVLNRPLVSAYIAAFRAASAEFSVAAEPDLNSVLRIPGALDSAKDPEDGALEAAVMACVGEALDRLNQMREQEGRGIEQELRVRMAHLREADVYKRQGKSYLTIGFGCTGGQHRSVMIAEEVGKRLHQAGYRVKVVHRDMPK